MQHGHSDALPADSYFDLVQEGYLEHAVPVYQLYEAVEFINRYSNGTEPLVYSEFI